MVGTIFTNHEIVMGIIPLVFIDMMDFCTNRKSPSEYGFCDVNM